MVNCASRLGHVWTIQTLDDFPAVASAGFVGERKEALAEASAGYTTGSRLHYRLRLAHPSRANEANHATV
jgi:hypothetical protein